MGKMSGHHLRRIQQALNYIESHLEQGIAVEDAADEAALSPWHFQRLFHEVLGVPVKHYVRRRRLSLASLELLQTHRRIIDIALDAGFGSQEAFTRAFAAQFGLPPLRYRAQGRSSDLSLLQFPAHTGHQPDASPAGGTDIEVFHRWTSSGEMHAVAGLRQHVEAQGYRMKEFAIPGYGHQQGTDLLAARVTAGMAPTLAWIAGQRLQDWARVGLLADLEGLAEASGWDAAIPAPARDFLKHGGRYVAMPLNIHRTNCLWVNAALLRDAGVEPPASWSDFIAAAQVLEQRGFAALSCGNEPWQIAMLFQSIVLGIGGTDFFRKAFVDLDPRPWSDPAMSASLEVLRRVRPYAHACRGETSWDGATRQVIRGKAAMQVMADWARAEFQVAGAVPGQDFFCVPPPGNEAYAFQLDSIAMFRHVPLALQGGLGELFMGDRLQRAFSLDKGSIPGRLDVVPGPLEQSVFRRMEDFLASVRRGLVVPSWYMSLPAPVRTSCADVLMRLWNGALNVDDAQRELANAARRERPA